MTGALRVTKRDWYDRYGGFANPLCFRRQRKGRGWGYYVRVE